MSIERIDSIRSKLADWKVDGILITNLSNIRWASGFTGSAGTIAITQDKALLGTDFRYWQQAANQAPEFELVKMGRTAEFVQIDGLAMMTDVDRLGFEASNMTVAAYSDLKKKCAD